MEKRECNKNFKAENLYVAFPSLITDVRGEVSTKMFEGISAKVIEQTVVFSQQKDPIFVIKTNDGYESIDYLSEEKEIIYCGAEITNRGLMKGDISKHYVNVINSDIVLVSELDFISKLGKMTMKDRIVYLKYPFKEGSLSLKKAFLDMQLNLKDSYSIEDLEEILFYIEYLNREPKKVVKQYLNFFQEQDYFLGELEENKQLKYRI